MEEELKFCVNCAHYYEPHISTPNGPEAPICRAEIRDIDLVTGTKSYNTCSYMRTTIDCGREAKLFKSKQYPYTKRPKYLPPDIQQTAYITDEHLYRAN